VKRDTKNNGIEIITPGSDIDLLVTAIFKRSFLVCDQYSRHIPKQDIEELDHEGGAFVAQGCRNGAIESRRTTLKLRAS
jgi:hypothetical protein